MLIFYYFKLIVNSFFTYFMQNNLFDYVKYDHEYIIKKTFIFSHFQCVFVHFLNSFCVYKLVLKINFIHVLGHT